MTQPMFENITGDEKRTLLSLCLIAAKQLGFVLPDDSDLHGNRLLSLYKEWGGDNWAKQFKPVGLALKTDDAAANFLTFLKKKAGELERRKKVREIELESISVSMFVPLGERGGFTYSMTGKPPADADKEEIMEMYAILRNKVMLGYEEQITNRVQLPLKQKYVAQSGDTAETFDFTSIRSVSEGGKRSFFLKGAPFVKYGVRVFPNVLSSAGIDPESINGEKFIAGTAIFTKKANGDPDLVVSIQKGVTGL